MERDKGILPVIFYSYKKSNNSDYKIIVATIMMKHMDITRVEHEGDYYQTIAKLIMLVHIWDGHYKKV